MKRTLLLIFLVALSSAKLFAQLDGSVGIKFKPTSGDYNLIRSYSQEWENLIFDTRYPLVFSTITTGAFEFINHTGSPLMAIRGSDAQVYFSGNVGMGTTSPGAKLHVNQSSNTEWAALFQNGGGDGKGVRIKSGAGADVPSLQVEDNYGNSRFVVKSNGKVGVGTPSPNERLEVNGNIRTSGGNLYTTLTNNDLQFNRSGTSYISNLTSGGSLAFTTAGGSSNIRMFINDSGQIGIGTTSPGSYQLAVEGKIGAHEIKVTTSGWADFVFKDDYVLRPLAEVEQHIQQKGHLPDVPSEAEVLENGIELGAMDAKLLQKIEELTLYAIAQQKTSEEQARRIREQAEEMERLKQENLALQKLTEKLLELEEKVHQLQADK